MCGIAGFLLGTQFAGIEPEQLLQQMGNAIRHRGPDAASTWWDQGIALVHRRLSIIDLSDAGTQPIHSPCGRYVIVFNGEIYNYQELRQAMEAQGEQFSSQTDTEVLLRLVIREGERALDKLNGMFAFVVWDKTEQSLFAARDRLGKKPLYLYQRGEALAFASEIKAILALPGVQRRIRPDAAKDFFFYQYVPDPKTIFTDIVKLPPGHWLKRDKHGNIQQQRYWQLSFNQQISGSEQQIGDDLRALIDDATRIRLVSDVPLGAFLSGGIDSSAVVGLMAKHSKGQVTTCAIGFDDEKFDEVHFARKVAAQFNTDHHEFTVKESVSANFAQISSYFDEPFADPSYIPTFFVAKLARQAVTVALAGDGGDESFAGYSKYNVDQTEQRLRSMFPKTLRSTVFPPLAGLSALFGRTFNSIYGRKANSLLRTLALEPDQGFFVTNSFFHPDLWQQLAHGDFARETREYNPATMTRQKYHEAPAEDHLSKVLYTDIHSYLPGDILVKVDRMTMANSLEARAPLLDYRVVEYAASIPSALKLHGQEKKYILKKSLEGFLSDEILYRKKMGFSVPLALWLKTELKHFAEQAFSQTDGALAQLFHLPRIQHLWQQHLQGQHQHTQELWSLLVFSQWWDLYIAELPLAAAPATATGTPA